VTRPAPVGVHRRHDPLRDAWVLVSPGRGARPWRGEVEAAPTAPPPYDPTCQLCPGNVRASGARNDAYDGTYVFDNDFPALRPEAGDAATAAEAVPAEANDAGPGAAASIRRAEAVSGLARVICFSPRHDRSLGQLADAGIRRVIDTWADQTAELGRRNAWVQVFENRGEAMGASNPHPHGQAWAPSAVPTEPAREDASQRAHLAATRRVLLDDVRDEEREGDLVVDSVGDWLSIVPFWAAWPFETLLIGPPDARRLSDLEEPARDALAHLLGRLLRRYDGLFDRPFPYSMGWHQAPFTEADQGHWRLHGHVYPPLLRADARKFMVGYELLAEPQRDLTPEEAAERLRAVEPGDPPAG
jgi:UDPglucose--hexose-1-phosphate uridylyltransferase